MWDSQGVAYLAAIPFFTGLPSEELEALQTRCHPRTLDQGESILLEGEPADGLYFVRRGAVRIYKSSPEGRVQVLIVLGPGQSFNDVPIFDGGPNPASADSAESATEVIVIPAELIRRLIATSPIVAANVVRILATRLRHLTLLVEDLSLRHIIPRVGRLLLEASSMGETTVEMTQQEMATRVGTAREVVSRALRELERQGAISRRGRRGVAVNARRLGTLLAQPAE